MGDAWWQTAEDHAGFERKALRHRAGKWYDKARGYIRPGLDEEKVAKRLAEIAADRAESTSLATSELANVNEEPPVETAKSRDTL